MDKVKIYNLIDSLSDIQYETPEKLAEKALDGLSEFLNPIAIMLKIKIPEADQFEKYVGDQTHLELLEECERKTTELNARSLEYVSNSPRRENVICGVIKYPEGCSGILMVVLDNNHVFKHIGRQIIELFIGSISLALTMRKVVAALSLPELIGNAFRRLGRAGVECVLAIDMNDPKNGFWIDSGGLKQVKISGSLRQLVSAQDGTLSKKLVDEIKDKLPTQKDFGRLTIRTFETARQSFKCLFTGNFKSDDVVYSRFKSLLNDLENPSGYEEILAAFHRLKEDHKLIIKGERVAAILETAVAINHEINNPLTAVLGNTQLLLLRKDDLPEDVVTKINTIEKSALRIREVTQKLMTVVEPITTSYTDNLEMLDIEKSSSREDDK